jgi:GDP-L-fucose synthase
MDDGRSTADFWARQRVCVTGGTGFLGSYVLEGLRRRGAGLIAAPASTEYNLVEPGRAESLLRATRPNLVLHLAAHVGGIGANQTRPAEFLYDNLVMGAQLIDAAWKTKVEKVVVVGTVCSYPKFTPVPFREEDLWNGYPEETNAPYGLAKKMLLAQAQAYRKQYGFNAVYVIPANLYGPRDNFNLETSHVIPALIRKCLEAREADHPTVVIWGDGTPTREFLYAEDAAEGILLAAEHYNSGDPVNLGSGSEVSIRDLARSIARITQFAGKLEFDTRRPNGQPRRSLDVSRAQARFGFQARTPLEEGLQRTVAWYQTQRTRSIAVAENE